MSTDLTPADLDIDPASGSPQQLYRWFLASVLFGRPIQQSVAAKTYRTLLAHGLTTPSKFGEIQREPLRRLLDRGGYVRLDYQMADTLHAVMRTVADEYGSVHRLVATSQNDTELVERLTALTGIGPVTARIFSQQVPAVVYGSARKDARG
jgi:3-methyladenine DNA glycosylase/8-oxoguanine DNA glycosylase